MPTTVHIPDALLAAVDKRAGELRISRNRLIVRAVEEALRKPAAWPEGFLERFRQVEPEHAGAVDEMLAGIIANRRSKGPIKL